MSAINNLLDEYAESHQNKTNKAIHWICVPAIFLSLVGLQYNIKLPFTIAQIQINIAIIVMLFVTIYYFSLSKTLWVGMLLFAIACLLICNFIESLNIMPLWLFSIIIFITAWIGQFYGHHIEGKKPSFLKDLQFLLIGPAWLMSFIYKKINIAI